MNTADQIQKLLKEIVQNHAFGDPETWTNANYTYVSERIQEKTGEILSARTLRRIFDSNYFLKYDYIPKNVTLDVLAQFAGHQGWLEYCHSHGIDAPLIPKGKTSKKWILLLLLAVIVILVLMFLPKEKRQKSIKKIPQIDIEIDHASILVPNTVSFQFNIPDTYKDTVALRIVGDQTLYKFQRASGPLLKAKHNKYSTAIKDPSSYTYRVITQDSVVHEAKFFGLNKEWEYFIYDHMNNRQFGYQPIQKKDGIAYSSIQQSLDLNLDKTYGWFTRMCYVQKIPVSLDDCTIEARIKNVYEDGPSCDLYKFTAYGKKSEMKLFLAETKCFAQTKLYLSEVRLAGIHDDVGKLKREYSDWTKIRVEIKDFEAAFYMNGEEVKRLIYTQPMDTLMGFNIWFIGAGEVDYVRCYDEADSLVYTEEF
jgi:hypothetical protein